MDALAVHKPCKFSPFSFLCTAGQCSMYKGRAVSQIDCKHSLDGAMYISFWSFCQKHLAFSHSLITKTLRFVIVLLSILLFSFCRFPHLSCHFSFRNMPAQPLTASYCKPTSFQAGRRLSEMLAHFLPITEWPLRLSSMTIWLFPIQESSPHFSQPPTFFCSDHFGPALIARRYCYRGCISRRILHTFTQVLRTPET